MPGALLLTIVCDKSDNRQFTLTKELANKLPAIGRSCGHPIAPIKVLDVREPPIVCDICIHFETPYAVWFPWAKSNCIFVNAESWKTDAWKGYIDSFDVAVIDSEHPTESGFRHCISMKKNTVESEKIKEMLTECSSAIEYREPVPKHMPPLLNIQDCPPISVITLVHNRPKFIENACLNLLSSDYPRDKIEWIVIDDSDPESSPSNRVIQFSEKFAPGEISYIPLLKKTSIGEKRNMAVEKAKHNIIVMMDDDDHYPSTSFRRRVAYLLKSRKRYECATCTTIAMYDLLKGTSAVNVPPFTLSLGERCSEASMVFTKQFWEKRKFPETDMAEGEGFLKDRESQVVEMPPQQLIVALSHGTNLSSRRMPETKPGCFWGFPRPLLEFLHGIVGVKIEEDKST
jgi:hypothetical protein